MKHVIDVILKTEPKELTPAVVRSVMKLADTEQVALLRSKLIEVEKATEVSELYKAVDRAICKLYPGQFGANMTTTERSNLLNPNKPYNPKAIEAQLALICVTPEQHKYNCELIIDFINSEFEEFSNCPWITRIDLVDILIRNRDAHRRCKEVFSKFIYLSQ